MEDEEKRTMSVVVDLISEDEEMQKERQEDKMDDGDKRTMPMVVDLISADEKENEKGKSKKKQTMTDKRTAKTTDQREKKKKKRTGLRSPRYNGKEEANSRSIYWAKEDIPTNATWSKRSPTYIDSDIKIRHFVTNAVEICRRTYCIPDDRPRNMVTIRNIQSFDKYITGLYNQREEMECVPFDGGAINAYFMRDDRDKTPVEAGRVDYCVLGMYLKWIRFAATKLVRSREWQQKWLNMMSDFLSHFPDLEELMINTVFKNEETVDIDDEFLKIELEKADELRWEPFENVLDRLSKAQQRRASEVTMATTQEQKTNENGEVKKMEVDDEMEIAAQKANNAEEKIMDVDVEIGKPKQLENANPMQNIDSMEVDPSEMEQEMNAEIGTSGDKKSGKAKQLENENPMQIMESTEVDPSVMQQKSTGPQERDTVKPLEADILKSLKKIIVRKSAALSNFINWFNGIMGEAQNDGKKSPSATAIKAAKRYCDLLITYEKEYPLQYADYAEKHKEYVDVIMQAEDKDVWENYKIIDPDAFD